MLFNVTIYSLAKVSFGRKSGGKTLPQDWLNLFTDYTKLNLRECNIDQIIEEIRDENVT